MCGDGDGGGGGGDPSVTVLSQLSLVAPCHAAGPSTSSPWHCLTMTGSHHHHHHHQQGARALPTSRLTTHHTYTLLCSVLPPGSHHTNEWKQPVRYTPHQGISGDTRGYHKYLYVTSLWYLDCPAVASVTGSKPSYSNYWGSSVDGNLFINHSKPNPNIYN